MIVPPPTPNRRAERPRRGGDRGEAQRAGRTSRGILRAVSAPTADALAEALRPLTGRPRRAPRVFCDIDGTLAPIVERAEDAHVREEISRPARPARPPLRLRGLHLGALRGRGAPARRRRRDRLRRLARRRAARAGRDDARAWCRRSRAGRSACGASPPSATRRELRLLRVRIEDKGPIAAFHWRGVPDEEAARARSCEGLAQEAEAAGLAIHWGRKVLEIRPPVPDRQGPGGARARGRRRRCGPRSSAATTPPTSTPSTRSTRCCARRRARRGRARGRPLGRGPGGDRRARRPGGGRRGGLRARAGGARAPTDALPRLPAHRGAAVRRRGHRARGRGRGRARPHRRQHARVRGARLVGPGRRVAGCGWAAAPRPRRASPGCSPARARPTRCPSSSPARSSSTGSGRSRCSPWRPARSASSSRRSRRSRPATRCSWRSLWRKQSAAVEAIEGRDGVEFWFDRSSPFGPPQLVRVPGLRKIEPEEAAAAELPSRRHRRDRLARLRPLAQLVELLPGARVRHLGLRDPRRAARWPRRSGCSRACPCRGRRSRSRASRPPRRRRARRCRSGRAGPGWR